ncbi:MAG: hypothetical protein U1E76_27660 [Planctomycetota bacterium]
MKLVIGIDEAGFGPQLGPLVVAAAVFATPDELPASELYRALRAAVCRKRTKRPGDRVFVDDSKQLYHFGEDLRQLEAPLLAFLHCRESGSALCLGDLLGHDESLIGDLRTHPWYDPSLRVQALPAPVPADVERVRRALAERGIRFLGFDVSLVLEAELNTMLRATGNKAATHARLVMRLLARALGRSDSHADVHVDRLGGRVYYEAVLAATFPMQRIRSVLERPSDSVYEIHAGERRLSVAFHTRGDGRYLPIALSSMTAKYLRERFMESFNAFFARRLDGLRPTAGYYGDAGRFLRDIAPIMSELEIARDQFVRAR